MDIFNEVLVVPCKHCGIQMQTGATSGVSEVDPTCARCRKNYRITDYDVDTSRVDDSTVRVYYAQEA